MAFVLLAIMALMAAVLAKKWLPAIVLLPLTALVLAFVAVVPSMIAGGTLAPVEEVAKVVEQGATRLATLYLAVVLGGILAAHIKESKVAERIIRTIIEFGGDNAFLLATSLLVVSALLFTTLSGLGAVIMVATLVLPVLASVGIEDASAGAAFLMSLSLGGTLNPVNWQLFRDVLKLDDKVIIPYALAVAGVFLVVLIAFVAAKTARLTANFARSLLPLIGGLVVIGLIGAAVAYFGLGAALQVWLAFIFGIIVIVAVAGALIRFILRQLRTSARWTDGFAYAAPLFPVVLLIAGTLAKNAASAPAGAGRSFLTIVAQTMGVSFVVALFAGVVFAFLSSYRGDGKDIDLLMKSVFQGFQDVIPALALIAGIGMLLTATMMPQVSQAVAPIISHVIPSTAPLFVTVFFLLAFLSLYRGPLNLYGMGSGIVGLMLATGRLAPEHIMAAFFSVGMMQGVCDPTNTFNVWIASNLKVDVFTLTRRTFLWVWLVVLAGLIIGAWMFAGGFAR